MAVMESVDLSRHPTSQQPAPDLPGALFSGVLVVVALGLAVALWHLSSSPRQAVSDRHFHAGAHLGQGPIGPLVRWRGHDGAERLLVTNARRDAVVAYDANTGKPLASTDAGHFSDISRLELHGDVLLVIDRSPASARRVQVLRLPGLRLGSGRRLTD